MGQLTTLMGIILFAKLSLAVNWGGQVQFAPTFNCIEKRIHQSKCIATKPKDFSEEEKQEILSVLAKLPASAQPIFNAIFVKGRSLKFYRHSSGSMKAGAMTYKNNPSTVAWVDLKSKDTVHITDLFFSIRKPINDLFNFQDYILTHELVHLYDNHKKMTRSDSFLNLYGWHQAETGESSQFGSVEFKLTRWQTTQATYQEVDAIREEVIQLFHAGHNHEATETNLSFGQEHGHPTSYSMTNPYENLAEIITHHLLDPASLHTAPNEVHDWLHREFPKDGGVFMVSSLETT